MSGCFTLFAIERYQFSCAFKPETFSVFSSRGYPQNAMHSVFHHSALVFHSVEKKKILDQAMAAKSAAILA